MYQVLYRKYRPRFFADVVGQPQVTVTLKNELQRGRISHAYLFTGSRGTGKTTCAKILARAVNCLSPREGDPCGECEICRGLEEGSILDVVEIDAASNNGVDSIRTLIEESNFTPASAKYRVYIIDEVHMLSVAAFNALLKTLEEPPAHVIFILATTEVHKLLPTILSRCQRFDFRRIGPEDIGDRLSYVAGCENGEIDRDAALLIARIADGAMRDALSLLDQCLGRSSHVTLDIVNQTAGVAARDYLSGLAASVVEGNASAALELIDSLHRESKDMSRLCEELAEYFRGLMLLKTMRDPSAVLALSSEEIGKMADQAKRFSLSTVLHCLNTMEEALNKMRYGNQRSQLEMAFVRLCSPQLDDSREALMRRLEALERGAPVSVPIPAPAPIPKPEPEAVEEEVDGGAPLSEEADPFVLPPALEEIPPPPEQESPVQAAPAPEKPAPASKPAQTVDPRELYENAVEFLDWPEILQIIKGTTKSVAMAFSGSNAYISGDYMLIDAPELAFELLKRPEQRARMRDAIRRITGRAYKLGPYRAPETEKVEEDFILQLERRAKDSGIQVQTEEREQADEDQVTF